MLFRTLSASVIGIESRLIEVEVDATPSSGVDARYSTVGLPDAAVRESRERLQAAMRNCGFDLPTAWCRSGSGSSPASWAAWRYRA